MVRVKMARKQQADESEVTAFSREPDRLVTDSRWLLVFPHAILHFSDWHSSLCNRSLALSDQSITMDRIEYLFSAYHT